MRKVFSVLLCCVSCASFADSGVHLGVGASGVTGLNVSAGFYDKDLNSYFLRHFGARIDFAHTDPLKSAIDSAIDSFMRDGVDVGDGIKIDNGELDAWHAALLVDYYPFAGAWRISAGYAWGGADLSADIFGKIESAPANRFCFYLSGDHYYYNGNDFGGVTKIDWDFSGPYFGTGFDIGLFCGFVLFFDAGVVFTNRSPRISIDIPHEQLYLYDKDAQTWLPITIPALDNDVAHATRDANKKLSDLRLFPLIKFGFLYRF